MEHQPYQWGYGVEIAEASIARAWQRGSSTMQTSIDPTQEQAFATTALHSAECFGDLYDAYFPRVYRYVLSRVASSQDAEDLVSEIFVKVIEHGRSFRYQGAGSLTAWLFRIAHNHLHDFYRRQRRTNDVGLEAADHLPDGAASLDTTIIHHEQHLYLRRLIGTLPERQQHVLLLKFLSGLSNREIAGVIGLSEQAVATYLGRGLKQLHKVYGTTRMVGQGSANEE